MVQTLSNHVTTWGEKNRKTKEKATDCGSICVFGFAFSRGTHPGSAGPWASVKIEVHPLDRRCSFVCPFAKESHFGLTPTTWPLLGNMGAFLHVAVWWLKSQSTELMDFLQFLAPLPASAKLRFPEARSPRAVEAEAQLAPKFGEVQRRQRELSAQRAEYLQQTCQKEDSKGAT